MKKYLAKFKKKLKQYFIKTFWNKDKKDNKNILNTQLGAKGWENVYLSNPEPLSVVKSEVAKELIKLSTPSAKFIEMGCGSANISAELAIAGISVSLCDFSLPILKQARKLFKISELPKPKAILMDISKKLPLSEDVFDIVWSSGVLEHWEDNEIIPIIKEMKRISKKYVVSIVPNASSIFYRTAKQIAEERGTWKYGKELPRKSLEIVFTGAGLTDVTELILSDELAIHWFKSINSEVYPIVEKWWSTLDPSDPVKENQGYLLMTIGSTKK